jgi:hypothetical protein
VAARLVASQEGLSSMELVQGCAFAIGSTAQPLHWPFTHSKHLSDVWGGQSAKKYSTQ